MADPDSIRNVAVLGLGTMGHGIAQIFAAAGCRVRGYDDVAEARATTLPRVRSNLEKMVAAGLFDAGDVAGTLERITVCDSEEDALQDADFLTEVIRENLVLKQTVFERIEASISTECVVASNTSSYPMSQMSIRMKHPERALNTHWFNPPHIIPLVEVVPGEKTAPETVDRTVQLLEGAGKLAVPLKKEIPGFLVNRVQMAMYRELLSMREQGIATTEQIDLAIRESVGIRLAALGPLAVLDYAGLDTNDEVMKVLAPDLADDVEFPPSVQELVRNGHYGAKAGKGLYEYAEGDVEQGIEERNRMYMAVLRTLKEERES